MKRNWNREGYIYPPGSEYSERNFQPKERAETAPFDWWQFAFWLLVIVGLVLLAAY